MIDVPVVNGTIPHEIEGRFGAAHILFRPASTGTGVIASGGIRVVLELAGVHDVLTKSLGSTNPQNVIKATLEALRELRDAETIARDRGVPLHSLRA
jgi:small subunit ribosomal protein S5